MQCIKLSEFLKLEIKPFLLGAFLSRIMEVTIDDKKYFYAYSSFRSSHAVFQNDFDLVNYAKDLRDKFNKHSGHYNWNIYKALPTSTELRFYLLNDLNMSKTMFYKTLYSITMRQEWVLDEEFNDSKKDFIRGFIELRGSVDTTAKLIAQDYFYDTSIELKKAQIITDQMGVPIKYANFNARNLQPQFVSGENRRNAQFRINILFYAKEIGFINYFKAEIFNRSYYSISSFEKGDIKYFDVELPSSRNDDATFIKYINFFTNNIYQKNLTAEAVKELRKRLGFKTEFSNEAQGKRNMSLIQLFNEISPDECAICGTKTTFLNKNTGRQHFEIHHVISFCNGKEVDNIANLVKLCPTCHDMLKKNRALKDDQLAAIRKILHNHQEIFEFTSSYLGIDDINQLSEKIWEMLG